MFKVLPLEEIGHFSKNVPIKSHFFVFLTSDHHYTIKLICFAFNEVKTNFVSHRRLFKPKSVISPKSSHIYPRFDFFDTRPSFHNNTDMFCIQWS